MDNGNFQQQPQAQQPQGQQQFNGQQPNLFDVGPSGKSRGIAALLAILVGTLGVHYFYLGKPMPGVVFLLVFILGFFLCGIPSMLVGVAALVQGILMFTMNEETFAQKWVDPNQKFPLF